jgi:hypothetical protein
MSLLNLNSPTGRSPRGKKSSRAWMGFGLVIAVLGIGSTFAASININGGQDTEFGQGSTRTVYCGGDEQVTIAPISTYVNTVLAEPGISFSARFATEYYTDRVGDFTPYNGISTTVNGKTGWWLLAINSAALAPDQDLLAIKTSTASEIFSERKIVNDVEGYYKVRSPAPFEEIVMPAVEFSEATFRTAGVIISDIPEECDDVVFVLSFFGETGTAQTMISAPGEVVKEVAYNWYKNIVGTAYAVSSSRTSFVPTSLVTADTTADSLKFIFSSVGATAIEADDLDKIIIETQADSF